jgi:preflagellin peptidase FlaK
MAFNPLLISAAAIGITLVYASVLDLRSRRVPVPTWYPMLAIGVPSTLWFYTTQFAVAPDYALLLLVLSVALAVAFYLFGRFNMIGGADVRALAFVTLLLPTFPFTPLLGEPLPGFFPLPMLVHAEIAALLAPLGVYVWNRRRGTDGPLSARLRGYPVTADEITRGRAFGFLMEELLDEDGVLRRRFYTLGESMGAMFNDTRLYTRELRVEPERFSDELALIRRASPVWISVGAASIETHAVGIFATLIVGDTLFYLLSAIRGA